MLTFVPLNLLNQFKKAANVYFLVISFLQTIDKISISSGKSVMAVPLTIVIFVSMLKDAFEDYKRHQNDAKENDKMKCEVLEGGEFKKKPWKEVRVGQIVKVHDEHFIPCDLVLLDSSGPKGSCYIETKNLDGETNLKTKQVHKEIFGSFSSNEALTELDGQVLCELPNNAIYKFEGNINLVGRGGSGEQPISLSSDSLLLRGSSLRNTDYVVGVAIFTGHDTKVMMNSAQAKYKFSSLELMTNKAIALILMVQIVMSLIAGTVGYMWSVGNTEAYYLEIDDLDSSEWV
mmetsp:Transcript_30520/g.46780  ORF Transcript_30520/g.46780 Transcript_30520/m.46780 type:complete len:289 (-) Transcript_30520:349-1215(-)